MQAWIEKRFYLVNLLVIGLSSGLVGLAVTSYAASKLMDQKPPRRPARTGFGVLPAETKKTAGSEMRVSQHEVIRRNLFCSYCVPVKAAVEESTGETSETPEPTVNMEDAELLATLIAKGDDRWSLATIRFKTSQRTRVVAMGSKLDDAEILKVESRRVTFQKGELTGYIDLVPGAVKPAPTPSPTTPPSPGPKGAPKSGFQAALEKGVRMVGPNKYEIDRSLVNEFIANANVASKDAAIFPHTRDGKPDGYRLGRVRPGGIFARLGLRSGDVVNSINNVDISSPDKLLGLYTQLPGSNHMTIGITRYGKPVSIDYSIK